MIAPTPIHALREAGTVVAFLGALLGVALLLPQAGFFEVVAPTVEPHDDIPWLALNPPEVPSAAFDDATGMTQEAVVSQFGAPMRVRRDADLPDGCVQSYVYATRVLTERTTTGVCFNEAGRVVSFVGETMTFEFGGMSDDPRDTVATAALMSILLAIPLSAILSQRRSSPLTFASLSLREGLPR